jgi:hypothetical protein
MQAISQEDYGKMEKAWWQLLALFRDPAYERLAVKREKKKMTLQARQMCKTNVTNIFRDLDLQDLSVSAGLGPVVHRCSSDHISADKASS